MQLTHSTFAKVGGSAVIGLALVLASALPANAASSSTTDAKNDTQQVTVTATTAKLAAKKDPYVDITKLTAKRSGATLKVTITLAKVKKGYVDQVAVLIRSAKTKTADSTLIIAPNDPTHSLISTGGTGGALPASITLKTKKGAKGTYTVTIPLSTIGSPSKVSVAASLVHLKSTSSTGSVSTSDTTGKISKTKSSIKWTAFLK